MIFIMIRIFLISNVRQKKLIMEQKTKLMKDNRYTLCQVEWNIAAKSSCSHQNVKAKEQLNKTSSVKDLSFLLQHSSGQVQRLRQQQASFWQVIMAREEQKDENVFQLSYVQESYADKKNQIFQNAHGNETEFGRPKCIHPNLYQFVCEECRSLLCRSCLQNAHNQSHHFIQISVLVNSAIERNGHHAYRKTGVKREQLFQMFQKDAQNIFTEQKHSNIDQLQSESFSKIMLKNAQQTTKLSADLRSLEQLQTKIRVFKNEKYELASNNNRIQDCLAELSQHYKSMFSKIKDILDRCEQKVREVLCFKQQQTAKQAKAKIASAEEEIEYLQFLENILLQLIHQQRSSHSNSTIVTQNSSRRSYQPYYNFYQTHIAQRGEEKWQKHQEKLMREYLRGKNLKQHQERNEFIKPALKMKSPSEMFNKTLGTLNQSIKKQLDQIYRNLTNIQLNNLQTSSSKLSHKKCSRSQQKIKQIVYKQNLNILQANNKTKLQNSKAMLRSTVLKDISSQLKIHKNGKNAQQVYLKSNNKIQGTKIDEKGKKLECQYSCLQYGGVSSQGTRLLFTLYMPFQQQEGKNQNKTKRKIQRNKPQSSQTNEAFPQNLTQQKQNQIIGEKTSSFPIFKAEGILQHTNCGVFIFKTPELSYPKNRSAKYQSNDSFYAFGGILGSTGITSCVFRVDPFTDKREVVGSIREPLAKFGYCFQPISFDAAQQGNLQQSASTIMGMFYVCGGVNQHGEVVSSFRAYEIFLQLQLRGSEGSFQATDKRVHLKQVQKKLPSLDYRRYQHTLTHYQGCLYAIGGRVFSDAHVQDPPTALVEKYQLNGRQKWMKHDRCHLLQPRTNHHTIVLPSGMFVVGGTNGCNHVSSIEKYQEQRNIFIHIVDLANPGRNLIVMPLGTKQNQQEDGIVILSRGRDRDGTENGNENVNENREQYRVPTIVSAEVINVKQKKSLRKEYLKLESNFSTRNNAGVKYWIVGADGQANI